MLCEGRITAEDVLRKTAAERVDGIMEMLLRYLSYDEVRHACHERIGGDPLAEHEILRTAYFKHCARFSDR
jgi:hypothetical protein